MKKILTASLAGLLVLGGCGSGSDESSNTSGAQNEDEKDKTQQEEKDQNEGQDNTEDKKDSDMNNNDSDESSKSDENNDDTQNNEENNDENNQSSDKDGNNTEAKHPMNKDRAQTELEEYEEAFKKVISYTKDDGELKEYKTKDKLKEHFVHFMSEEQADELINTYFEMQDGALHVKAMDGPKFLNSDQPFEFKQGSNGNYKVIQETDNELNGHIKTTYTLTVNDGGYWIIQDVTSESLE